MEDTRKKTAEVLEKLNLPGSLFPMPVSNAMLIIGSMKTGCECDFPLHLFLIFGGAIGLNLIVLNNLAKYVVKWVMKDSVITPFEKKVLVFVKIFAFALFFLEVVIFIAMSIVVFDAYSRIQFDTPNDQDCKIRLKFDSFLAPHHDQVYCEYSMFMFSFCLMVMFWVFATFAFLCFGYIAYGLTKLKPM